ncbi:SpdD protein [Streptomyces sp. NPDC004609]|uniref:SpdD protein n=1 Tax=Streptomyces sp. NPDC004609 TaxID=3364704 RepID=UPI00368E3858
MLLRPKLPDAPPVPTAVHIAAPIHPAVTACACQHHAPAPVAPGRQIAPWVGAAAAVAVLGVVLTALLATVALTAVAVSIAALVLRSLLTGAHKR